MNNEPRGPLGILGDDGGIAQIGAELVARPNGITDADGIDHDTWQFQWTRNGLPITGATEPTYRVTQADTGADVGLTATYRDRRGKTETVKAKPVSVPDPRGDLDAYWRDLYRRHKNAEPDAEGLAWWKADTEARFVRGIKNH